MSIDIGIVTAGISSRGVELTAHRAAMLWREDPEKAMAGDGLFSIEAIGELDRSTAIHGLASENPELFVELTSHLTPIIQDIFFQHYLLGRTFAQIGALLFPDNKAGWKSPQQQSVKIGNQLGLRALCAFIKYKKDRRRLGKSAEWNAMLKWRPRTDRKLVSVRAARDLGDFVIHPNGQLNELFALGTHSCRSFGV